MIKILKKIALVPGPLVLMLTLGLILLIPVSAPKPSSELSSFQTLSPQEQAILKIKKSDPQGKIQNYELIKATAIASDELRIYQCQVRPVVIKLKLGQSLTFKNLDPQDHIIESDLSHQYTVPAKGTTTIKADLGHGAGVYSIVCDGRTSLSGLFLVTE